jgi:hypothetical protein
MVARFVVLDCKLKVDDPPTEEDKEEQMKALRRCTYLKVSRLDAYLAADESKAGRVEISKAQLEDDPELLFELQLLAGVGVEGELELRNEEDGKSTRKYVLHNGWVHLYYGVVDYPDAPDASFGLTAISELESAGEED